MVVCCLCFRNTPKTPDAEDIRVTETLEPPGTQTVTDIALKGSSDVVIGLGDLFGLNFCKIRFNLPVTLSINNLIYC